MPSSCGCSAPGIVLLCWIISNGAAQSPYFRSDPEDRVFYWIGNANLVISVPHDGIHEPEAIPDRHDGCYDDVEGRCVFSHECEAPNHHGNRCKISTTRDTHTLDIAGAFRNEMEKLTKRKPHMVVNRLHRRKMDADGSKAEATFGVQQAKDAYNNYTLFLHMAMAAVGRSGKGHGLFLDFHGHGHSGEWVGLGYGLPGSTLESGYYSHLNSTLAGLGDRQCGPDVTCFRNIISGDRSLGSLLTDEGFTVIPSSQIQFPDTSVEYHSSSYNTDMYGSRERGTIDSIRIDIPNTIRFGNWQDFAASLAVAVESFMRIHSYL